MTFLAQCGKRPAFAPSACSALNDDFALGPGMGLAAVRCSARGSVASLARRTFETKGTAQRRVEGGARTGGRATGDREGRV